MFSSIILTVCVADQGAGDSRGLFPGVVNVAAGAVVTANASCGEDGAEEFCRLSFRGGACGVCDAHSPDLGKRHPPSLAVDGTSRWWQSPSLATGPQYEWVTLTLDLRQVRFHPPAPHSVHCKQSYSMPGTCQQWRLHAFNAGESMTREC